MIVINRSFKGLMKIYVRKKKFIKKHLMIYNRYPPQTGTMPGPYGPPGPTGHPVSQQPQYAPPNGQHMM